MTQPLHTLVTHAGAFHADELMAIVLLEQFYLLRPVRVWMGDEAGLEALVRDGIRPVVPAVVLPDGREDRREPAWVVRTRSPALLTAARNQADTFVIDVGGQLDPGQLNLDHHQASMTDGWDDGTPYSSTGLVWRWLQAQGHLSSLPQAMQTEIEDTLIRPLDAHDNGVALCNEALVVEAYNRGAGNTELQAAQFDKALDFLREVLANHLHRARMKLEAQDILAEAWMMAQARKETFVILPEALPYPDGAGLLKALSEDQATLLGVPGKGNRYSLISLPGDSGRFSSKCPMPEDWGGRMDFIVDTPEGAVELAFSHKTGFMCVVKGGAVEARRVARTVVAHQPNLVDTLVPAPDAPRIKIGP